MKKIDAIHDGLRELMHLCSLPEHEFDPFDRFKVTFVPIDQDEEIPQIPQDYELREEVDWKIKRQALNEVLNTLTEREIIVLHCRFFEYLTLEKTGERIGVGRERARGIEAKALRKLRHPFRRDKLMQVYFPEKFEKEKISRLAELAAQKEAAAEHCRLRNKQIREYHEKRIVELEEMKRIQEEERRAEESYSYSFIDVFGMVKWVVR